MSSSSETNPTLAVVAELRQLTDQILGIDDGRVRSLVHDEWQDSMAGGHYRLTRDWIGDPVILESPDGDWDKGSTYRAGDSGLTIGTNETSAVDLPFHERFRPVIDVMRARIAAKE